MDIKQEAKALKEEGNAAFQSKNFKKAIDYFTKAIAIDSDDHVLYSNRSGAYTSANDYSNALKDANECIKIKPDWPKGYSRKGIAEFYLGNLERAKEAYQTGLKYDPQNAPLLTGLKQVEESIAFQNQQMGLIINQLIQINPKYETYCKEDPQYASKLKSAIDGINNISMNGSHDPIGANFASMDPKVKEGFLDYISMKFMSRPAPSKPQAEYTTKEENSTNFEKKEPDTTPEKPQNEKDADTFKEKGNQLYKQKKFQEALECYDKAIELNPNEILLQSNKSAVYLEMKDYDKCLEICKEAIEKRYDYKADFSKVAKLYNRMASCYEHMGELKNAIQMYQSSLLEDNNRKTRTALKTVERKLENQEKQAYINPELAEQHRAKGNEFFFQSNYPAAIKEYDEAIKRNPSDAKLFSNRAAAYTKLLEYPLALKDCDTATELDPTYVKAWSKKGYVLSLMKDYTKALQAYDKGLALAPDSSECLHGKQQVIMKIQQSNKSGEVDQDQLQRGLADPEVQKILSDPQFNLILKNISEDPSRLSEYTRDPKISAGLEKLIAAGILRMA